VLAGVDYVVKRGIADPDRLGVGGHSYGGILTDQVIARDPRFKAAVASAGAANMFGMWGVDMYIREYALELGLPWRDREAFEHVSYPFFHADKITTATLFLCNELDENVPCVGSMQMYEALKSLDVPTRLVIYPNEYHGLTVPSYLRTACSGCSTGTGSISACADAAVALQERLQHVVRQRLRAWPSLPGMSRAATIELTIASSVPARWPRTGRRGCRCRGTRRQQAPPRIGLRHSP
jgi:dienelactone hydrolase